MTDDLIHENAALRARLESCMHTGDMEHARMAALIGATTDLLNVLATLRYPDMSSLWTIGGSSLENAYVALKRSADAVRPEADALLARMADMSRMVGEQNTTIGYQDAMIAELRRTLDAAYHGLMSYACGNSATALAEEIAAEIMRVLGNAPAATSTPESVDRQLSNAADMVRRFQAMVGALGPGPGPGKETSE